MATITSAQSGNFSATSTWVGGVVPGASDIAVAATGHVVAIDTDVTVTQVQQAGTGKFTLGNGRTLTGGVQANAGTFTSGGTVEVIATTSATITGNITATASTATNIAAVVMTGSGTLIINGNLTTGSNSATSETNGHSLVYANTQCAITVNGNVTTSATTGQGYKRGVHLAASSGTSQLTINGNLLCLSDASFNAYPVWTQANSTVTVTGNVTGGPGTGWQQRGIEATGTSPTINVTGDVTGGGNSGHGIGTTGTGATVNITGRVLSPANGNGVSCSGNGAAVNVIGTVTATAVTAIAQTGTASVTTVTGAVNGGSGSSAYGISSTGVNSTVTVIGSAVAASTLSHAVLSNATANGVIFQGDLTDSPQGCVAIRTFLFRMTATNSGTTKYANTVGYPNGTLVSRVSPNLTTGMPATTNVRQSTVYGANSELTGTLAVPPAASVAAGVPVDNTVGTAAVRLQDIAAVTGAQVAAAITNAGDQP